jgi:hypothetical protein
MEFLHGVPALVVCPPVVTGFIGIALLWWKVVGRVKRGG